MDLAQWIYSAHDLGCAMIGQLSSAKNIYACSDSMQSSSPHDFFARKVLEETVSFLEPYFKHHHIANASWHDQNMAPVPKY